MCSACLCVGTCSTLRQPFSGADWSRDAELFAYFVLQFSDVPQVGDASLIQGRHVVDVSLSYYSISLCSLCLMAATGAQ